MAAVSWASKGKRWQCDLNVHWFDRMSLPNTSANPAEYRRPSYSVPYATVNIQATFRVKDIELYSGCENIGNYRRPIRSSARISLLAGILTQFGMGAYTGAGKVPGHPLSDPLVDAGWSGICPGRQSGLA